MSDAPRESSIVVEEEATGRLLRAAGPRVSVPTERTMRVRSAVRGAWQTHHRRRAIRRRLLAASAFVGVAALLVVAVRVAMLDSSAAPLSVPVALVETVEGASRLQRGDAVRTDQWIETNQQERLALRMGHDSSLRVDRASRLRVLSSSVIELASGALYLDTGREDGSFEIRTPLGTARDLGTQFEVRLDDQSLRLRVRSGVVELNDGTRSISARAGSEITLTSTGVVTRPIAVDSTEWAWVARVLPPLQMEGVPLAVFLARVAREQGWTVEYGDARLAREAEKIVLHGSVSNLAPHEAAEVAITTSGLTYRLERGSLIVLRTESPRATERGNRP